MADNNQTGKGTGQGRDSKGQFSSGKQNDMRQGSSHAQSGQSGKGSMSGSKSGTSGSRSGSSTSSGGRNKQT